MLTVAAADSRTAETLPLQGQSENLAPRILQPICMLELFTTIFTTKYLLLKVHEFHSATVYKNNHISYINLHFQLCLLEKSNLKLFFSYILICNVLDTCGFSCVCAFHFLVISLKITFIYLHKVLYKLIK